MENSKKFRNYYSKGWGYLPKAIWEETDIDFKCKGVLSYLLTFANPTNYLCWPSQQTIASGLNISISTVKRCLKIAEKHGYIKKIRKFNGQGYGSFNVYKLLFMEFRSVTSDTSNDFRGVKTDTLEVSPVNHKHNNRTEQTNIEQYKVNGHPTALSDDSTSLNDFNYNLTISKKVIDRHFDNKTNRKHNNDEKNNFKAVVCYYLTKYRESTGIDHPPVKSKLWPKVIANLTTWDVELLYPCIDKYFEDKNLKTDHNILHFSNENIILHRVYDADLL
jgi:DNA-binding Lrp family transcriptional regulator